MTRWNQILLEELKRNFSYIWEYEFWYMIWHFVYLVHLFKKEIIYIIHVLVTSSSCALPWISGWRNSEAECTYSADDPWRSMFLQYILNSKNKTYWLLYPKRTFWWTLSLAATSWVIYLECNLCDGSPDAFDWSSTSIIY